jgi:glyoxylase-like metal-dependent hydrolase (beta-lactamase superfamily II)
MDVLLLPAHNPGPYTGPQGNNTYLLPGREPALIDAGVGDPRHLASIEAALEDAALARVLVTHVHSDHASGAAAVAARWPAAVFMKMPWPERDGRYPVRWTPVGDGDEIPAGDAVLRALHTPGHAPDHLCFLHVETRTVFSADLVVRDGTVVVPGSRGGRLADYLRSLERVRDLGPTRLLPAHGPAIDDPAAVIARYLDHRRARERQVIEALASGDTSPAAVVNRIYPALNEALVAAATDSVLAHLIKLEEEKRAERDEAGGWRLRTIENP